MVNIRTNLTTLQLAEELYSDSESIAQAAEILEYAHRKLQMEHALVTHRRNEHNRPIMTVDTVSTGAGSITAPDRIESLAHILAEEIADRRHRGADARGNSPTAQALLEVAEELDLRIPVGTKHRRAHARGTENWHPGFNHSSNGTLYPHQRTLLDIAEEVEAITSEDPVFDHEHHRAERALTKVLPEYFGLYAIITGKPDPNPPGTYHGD